MKFPKTVKDLKNNEVVIINYNPTPDEIRLINPSAKRVEHGATIVLKNNKDITPVTFELSPNKSSNLTNVYNNHKKIFTNVKVMDTTTRLIINDGKVFNHSNEFSTCPDYVNNCLVHNQVQQQRKVFMCCKIDSSIRMSHFKYGQNSKMSPLIVNNTYIKYSKISTHRTIGIGWLKYINPLIFLKNHAR